MWKDVVNTGADIKSVSLYFYCSRMFNMTHNLVRFCFCFMTLRSEGFMAIGQHSDKWTAVRTVSSDEKYVDLFSNGVGWNAEISDFITLPCYPTKKVKVWPITLPLLSFPRICPKNLASSFRAALYRGAPHQSWHYFPLQLYHCLLYVWKTFGFIRTSSREFLLFL